MRKPILCLIMYAAALLSREAPALQATPAPGTDQYLMTRHVREEAQAAAPVGRLPADRRLQFDIVLPVRDPAGLEKFLAAAYDPGSPTYRHFLTPAEFTRRFGPTQADWNELQAFARRSGFRVVGGSRDEMDLRMTGTVAEVEAAFHVAMRLYRHPTEARTYFSPDTEPTVGVQAQIWHVSGLDNFARPRPRVQTRSALSVQAHTTTGACPGNSYCGSDMRSAYYGTGPLTGAGQSIGLVEFYGYDSVDLNTYYANAGQSNGVPVNAISTDGTSVACVYAQGCDDTEQTLDMTQALGMAPGLAQLNVYVGSSDTAILSAMSVVPPGSVTGKVDAQLGCSWGWGPADPSADDPFFQKFAAQGQSFFTAAGDSAAYSSGSQYVFPADDPNVTVVGGTDLATTGPGGPWQSETAWGNGGGGYFAPDNMLIPAWQTAAAAAFNRLSGKPASTVLRNSPDVAAEANYDFYVCANQGSCVQNAYGGTSFAAPMWAGYMALVNQQALLNGRPAVGFLNPTLYALGNAGGSAYASAFHDVAAGSNGFPAVSGYDLATGWGSPNGNGLIAYLAGGTTAGFTLSGSTAVTVAAGSSAAMSLTSTASGGFAQAIALRATGQPAGVTLGFTPATIDGAGSSTLGFQVASTVAAGVYPITITATSAASATAAAITRTLTVTLTVSSANFALSAATTVAANAGGSGSLVLTSKASGGFAAPIALSAGGLPSGVTVTFSPASITGGGSTTATFHVGSTVAAGRYPIILSGTSGSLTHSTPVSLVVTAPNFALTVPATLTLAQGNRGAVILQSSVVGGFSSVITFAASGQPAGVSVSFAAASVSGAGSTTVSVLVGAGVAGGVYPITISGTGGGITQYATLSLVVTVPTFALTASSASLAVIQGASGAVTVGSKAGGGFTGTISLVASGQPAGVTVSFASPSITASGSTSVTFRVGAGVPAGAYPIVLAGASGTLGASAAVTLNVTAADFTLTPAAPSLVVMQGQGGSVALTAAMSGVLAGPVSLSVSAPGGGIGATLGTTTLTPPGAASLGLQVPADTPPGSYALTVTGTSGGLAHTAGITLVVAVPSPPVFSFAPVSTAMTLTHGTSTAFAVRTAVTGSASPAIALSVSGLPAGVTASISPASLTGAGTAVVTLTAPATAHAGTLATLLVSASAGGVTQSSTVALTLN